MTTLNTWIKNSGANSMQEIDWDFSEARGEKTTYLTHGLHSYSSKYIPQIPHNLIKLYSKRGELVLDPFVGSGTTLVEAKLLGRNSIGIDISKYPCLISNVKTMNISMQFESVVFDFLDQIRHYVNSYRKQKNISNEKYNHRQLKLDKRLEQINFVSRLYKPSTLTELLIIKAFIEHEIKNEEIKNLFLISLLGIIRKVSFLTSNFGNDYVPRKKDKTSDVLREFESRLNSNLKMVKEFNEACRYKDASIVILNNDSRNIELPDNSIDLITTHPPYISSIPYAEYYKLEMLWLGLNPTELDSIIIGGKRNSNDVVNRFTESMRFAIKEMHRVLRDRKYACIVIGNSRVKGKIIETNEIIKDLAKGAGFTFIQEIKRAKQDCSNAWMKNEYILIFKK